MTSWKLLGKMIGVLKPPTSHSINVEKYDECLL
jgi:hypothetical protein